MGVVRCFSQSALPARGMLGSAEIDGCSEEHAEKCGGLSQSAELTRGIPGSVALPAGESLLRNASREAWGLQLIRETGAMHRGKCGCLSQPAPSAGHPGKRGAFSQSAPSMPGIHGSLESSAKHCRRPTACREASPGAPMSGADAPPPGAEPDAEAEGGSTEDPDMELLRNLLARTLGLGTEPPERVLDELSLTGIARFMQSERCRRVVCMVGAGISTAAGIPDFRSPGTGLYANLSRYELPYPEAIFDISYFKQHPEPFFALAKELLPGQLKPTVCHYFMRLLKEKGLLLRCYTQNIDTLERVAGLQPEDLVEAHGTFQTAHCLRSSCRHQYDLSWVKEKIFSSLVPKCDKCQSVVKPDIVFFGENLPSRFFSLLQSDFQKVDLLIIMGTSLQVQPFASLVSRVPASTPRLLINKEKTGQSDAFMSLMGFGCGMDFDSDKAYRDVAWLGDCDEGCLALAELLGWKKELQELVRKEHAAIDAKAAQEDTSSTSGGDPKSRRGRADGSGGRTESSGAPSKHQADGKEP